MMLENSSSNGTQKQPDTRATSARVTTLATAAAALIAVSGVVLHFMGFTSHKVVLATFGADPGPFHKPTDALLVRGFEALVYGLWNTSYWTPLMIGAGVGVILGGTFLAVRVLKPAWVDTLLGRANAAYSDNKVVRAAVQGFTIPFLVASAYVYIAVTILVLSLLPAEFGFKHGKAVAQAILTDFSLKTPCVGGLHLGCSTFHSAGKQIAAGYLIDSSLTHIAFLDLAEMRVRVMERAGVEIRTQYRWGDPLPQKVN